MPQTGGQIATNIINDILLAGTLAASIFVKNQAHQIEAGNLISALAKVLQVVEAQMNPTQSVSTDQPSPNSGVTAQ